MKKPRIIRNKIGKKTNRTGTFFNNIPIYLICLLTAFWPIAEARIDIKIHDCESMLIPSHNGMYYDVAARFREIILFAAAVLLLVYWIIKRIYLKGNARNSVFTRRNIIPFVLMGCYVLLVIISSVVSEYPEISFWGITSQSEGIAANIGYSALFITAYKCFENNDSLYMLCNAASLSAAVIYIEFVVERFFGEISAALWNTASSGSAVTLMFGNSAYCGAFCAIILPLAMYSAFAEHNTVLCIIKSFVSGMLIPIIIGSYSTIAFYASVVCITAFSIYMLFNKETDRKRKTLVYVCIFSAVIIFLLLNRNYATDILISDAVNAGAYSPDKSWKITGAELNGKTLVLKNDKTSMTIEMVNENRANVYDKNTKPICELFDGTQVKFKNDYDKVSLALSDKYLIVDMGYEEEIRFYCYNDKLYFIGAGGKLVDSISESAFPSLSQYYGFGTGRGYIWVNSIPILQKCFFKGIGAGEFVFYFPQYDFVGALNTHGKARVITDKPHSLYLGIAISYGIPAFLIFCAIMFITIKRGIVDAFKKGFAIKCALLLSISSFLILGTANDSTPIYSPLFWIFAGAVISENRA